jgi:hypothetical protein
MVSHPATRTYPCLKPCYVSDASKNFNKSSPHGEHQSSGPRPVKLCPEPVNFSIFIKNYVKINSRI